MAVNRYDYLINDCDDPTSYPGRLRHTQSLPHSLERYQNLLDERDAQIFHDDSEEWYIRFWDCFDGQKEFPKMPCDCSSAEVIRQYLLSDLRRDPQCRHVFLEASHSWGPLYCSREMLVLLFTFHQVMPQFLEIALSFGEAIGRKGAAAFYNCIFRYEHFLNLNTRRFEIPQLDRSGHEIRHCYNLWSIEKLDPEDKPRHPWTIRQAGLYHSFDIENGRATWIHVKANNVLQKRIRQATARAEGYLPKDMQTLQGAFSATLLTHLIIVEWCSENWAQYLSYWECQLDDLITRVTKAPVDKVEKALMDDLSNVPDLLPRQGSFPISPSRRGTATSGKSFPASSRKGTIVTRNSFPMTNLSSQLHRTRSVLTGKTLTTRTKQIDEVPDEKVKDPIEIFDDFKFQDLQRLHFFSTKLQEADMVLGLNANILSEMMEYYRSYVEDPETPEAIRKGCRSDLNNFLQRTNVVLRELRTERTRISTLLVSLEDGKAMFDAVTQLRNIELNRRASKRMEVMTENMHELTVQTKRDTSSMHLITIVTLVFLPGTFIATFLGAGFYQWPQTSDGSGPDGVASFPIFRPKYFSLFMEITVALTAFTILIWWGKMWLVPRVQNRFKTFRGAEKQTDEEAPPPNPLVTNHPP